MAIDVKKINITLPEGVTTVGEISLVGNEASVQLEGTTVGTKTISVNYDGGAAKETTLTVTEETIFNTLRLDPADEVYTDGDVKLVAEFSRTPILGEVAITAPTGFVEKVAPAVVGNNVEATYTAGSVAATGATFTVVFRDGKAEKTAAINVVERPAVMQTVVAEPTDIRIGEDSKVTVTFDKAPVLDNVVFAVPEGVTQKGTAVARENTVEIVVTGATAGPAVIKVTHLTDAEQSVTVNVIADAVVATATAEPASIEIGQDSVITVAYDKAIVKGQEAIKVVVGEGLAEKVAYAENEDHTGGTITVTGGAVGTKTVTFTLGGVDKVVEIVVADKPAVSAVSVEPDTIEVGGNAKLKITL